MVHTNAWKLRTTDKQDHLKKKKNKETHTEFERKYKT